MNPNKILKNIRCLALALSFVISGVYASAYTEDYAEPKGFSALLITANEIGKSIADINTKDDVIKVVRELVSDKTLDCVTWAYRDVQIYTALQNVAEAVWGAEELGIINRFFTFTDGYFRVSSDFNPVLSPLIFLNDVHNHFGNITPVIAIMIVATLSPSTFLAVSTFYATAKMITSGCELTDHYLKKMGVDVAKILNEKHAEMMRKSQCNIL